MVSENSVYITHLLIIETGWNKLILQGIRNQNEYNDVLNFLNTFIYLDMKKSTFELAVNIYRSLRQRGITKQLIV